MQNLPYSGVSVFVPWPWPFPPCPVPRRSKSSNILNRPLALFFLRTLKDGLERLGSGWWRDGDGDGTVTERSRSRNTNTDSAILFPPKKDKIYLHLPKCLNGFSPQKLHNPPQKYHQLAHRRDCVNFKAHFCYFRMMIFLVRKTIATF